MGGPRRGVGSQAAVDQAPASAAGGSGKPAPPTARGGHTAVMEPGTGWGCGGRVWEWVPECAHPGDGSRVSGSSRPSRHPWSSADKDVGSCPNSQVFLYNLTTCQQTCRSLSEADSHCLQGFAPVDGCGCPDHTFLDQKGRCVPLAKCSCYHHGLYLEAGDVVVRQEERWWYHTECVSGCVCPDGLMDDGRGGCVVEEECPCVHNKDLYSPGDKIKVDCNTWTELKLEDKHRVVIQRDEGRHVAYTTREVGQYLVVESSTGIIVIWDKRTTVFIKLAPSYKGTVCGLCGNFDDRSSNDFTTRDHMVVSSELDFGNSWKEAPTCPDVDPTPFYEACVHDSCSCDTGGDCECFCSAVASYAQECTKVEACVFWRTPDLTINGIHSNISMSYLEGERGRPGAGMMADEPGGLAQKPEVVWWEVLRSVQSRAVGEHFRHRSAEAPVGAGIRAENQ
ncbi:hypothetical protein P7K49_040220 [Saguinus oedipus]|uniref:VWFD domain-containing protein n=1 Tax=Saguinus oedipus TaxID=9490 RepID=A0ABQ9T8R8_SAGOE|nr:hypothetical protein P7K49_040220 [Saguinus oedipus]